MKVTEVLIEFVHLRFRMVSIAVLQERLSEPDMQDRWLDLSLQYLVSLLPPHISIAYVYVQCVCSVAVLVDLGRRYQVATEEGISGGGLFLLLPVVLVADEDDGGEEDPALRGGEWVMAPVVVGAS